MHASNQIPETSRSFHPAAMCVLLLSLFASGTALAEPLQGKARQRFLQQMERVYREARTIQAGFREERRLEGLPKSLVFRGRIYMDLGRSFLFMDYSEPSSHVLRVQNGTVLFYVRGQATADVFDLENTPGAPPHGGLLSWSPIDFQGRIVPAESCYRLIPEGSEEVRGRVVIEIDRDSLLLESILIREPSGDSTEISLKDPVLNEPLPESATGFSLPQGTAIHRLSRP